MYETGNPGDFRDTVENFPQGQFRRGKIDHLRSIEYGTVIGKPVYGLPLDLDEEVAGRQFGTRKHDSDFLC